jgi:AraC family transcriptional regulator
MICTQKKPESNAEGYYITQIPKSTWAVFRSEKTKAMGTEILNIYNRAYSEWMPSSGYEKAPGPDNMEIYEGNVQEVWIPVRKAYCAYEREGTYEKYK